MEKFDAMRGKDIFSFQLKINQDIKVEVDVELENGIWCWNFFGIIFGKGADRFNIKERKFFSKNVAFYRIDEEKLNDAFHKLIWHIKHHSKHRLRLINLLDDETSKIWNKV